MSQAPFPIQPHLTAIAIAYRNRRLIADQVMPRVPVGKQEFKYLKHAMAEGFTIPDTKVGRRSKPGEVTFSATDVTASTVDYGLDAPIPQADIDNAPPNHDPRAKAVEQVTNLIELDREVRVANVMFNAHNYAVANKDQLSGTDQFSHADSHPIKLLTEVMDSMLMRPTAAVIGRPAFSYLAQHPDVVKAFHGNSGDAGIVPAAFIAQLLELEELIVGEAFVNTARKGQAAVMARCWGKHMAFMYRDKLADASSGTTFALTAQFGGRVAGSIHDPDIGLRGGERVRVGESVAELITAPDLGYLLQDVVA